VLRASDVRLLDGLPGSVADVYGLDPAAPLDHRVIAIKDHVGQRARVHPGRIQVNASCTEGESDGRSFPVSVAQRESDVVVRDAPSPV